MNRETLINFIDPVFYPLAALARRSRGVRVLMYHLVAKQPNQSEKNQLTVSQARFRAQLEIIRSSGFKVVSMQEAVATLKSSADLGQYLALTFDDFFADTVENAVPLLKEFKFPASFYVATNFIGSSQKFPWLEKGQDYPLAGTRKMVEEIAGLGFELGSHSCSHPVLSRLPPEQVREELTRSRKVLEDIIGRAVNLFSYPFGLPSVAPAPVKKLVADSGYAVALGTLMGVNRDFREPYYLRRNHISEFDHGAKFLRKLQGSRDWFIIWQRLRDR